MIRRRIRLQLEKEHLYNQAVPSSPPTQQPLIEEEEGDVTSALELEMEREASGVEEKSVEEVEYEEEQKILRQRRKVT